MQRSWINKHQHKCNFCLPFQAYLSILYLKPRIQIILREKKVQTKLIAKSLSMIENDVYKPQFIVSFHLSFY